jgi:hypothetical protein
MKHAQKVSATIVIAMLVLPQITFASWWNPTTWGILSFIFGTPQQEQVVSTTTQSQTHFDLSTTTLNAAASEASTTVATTSVPIKKKTNSLPKAEIQAPQSTQPVELKLQTTGSTTESTTSPSATTVYRGTPFQGQDGNWYYPNAYDVNGRNLQAPSESCSSGYTKIGLTTTGYPVCSLAPETPNTASPSRLPDGTYSANTLPSGSNICDGIGGCTVKVEGVCITVSGIHNNLIYSVGRGEGTPEFLERDCGD